MLVARVYYARHAVMVQSTHTTNLRYQKIVLPYSDNVYTYDI